MKYFTADTHFFHGKPGKHGVIEYCNRPFKDLAEMHEVLINNWNSKVNKKDIIYIVGDFSMGKAEETRRLLEKLNGYKFLVIGSHDQSSISNRNYFEKIDYRMIVKEKDIEITLSHYCMRVWPKSHYNTWHLFGHSHGRLKPEGKSWDCGVDVKATKEEAGIDIQGFIPLSFDEVIEIMKHRPDNFNKVNKGGFECI